MHGGSQSAKVGEVYNEYICGDLGSYYSQNETKRVTSGKAGSAIGMAMELYVDKLVVCVLFCTSFAVLTFTV